MELWPEKPPEKKDNKKSGKSKGGGGDVNKEKQDQKSSEPEPDADDGFSEGCKDTPGEDSDKESHSDECEEGGGGSGGGGGGGGSEGGKKKKKKKKKKNKGENGGSAPPNNGGGEEISKIDALVPSNLATSMDPKDLISPPIQHAYPYPHHVYYSPPPPPAYGLSYNTAYPVSSASYYVGAPITPMHAYNTPYPRLPPPPPPSDPIKHHGDYENEYEGGGYCSIM